MAHPILGTFLTDSEKCSNCLPNYFIRASESDKPEYRCGPVAFLHRLKSGATTIHVCLRKLLGKPYTWNGKTEKRNMGEITDGIIQPCSYFTLPRDPINRAVATYFFCRLKPREELCATHQLQATQADISQWVLHQRS